MLDPPGDWMLVDRQFFNESDNGNHGMDATAFDLWNPKTKGFLRLAKVETRWKCVGEKTIPDRGSGSGFSASAIDWRAGHFSYALKSPSGTKIYVCGF